MLPFAGAGDAVMASLAPSYYPPALTGLRGDNPGSYTAAHGRALEDKSDWGATTVLKEEYDLVVVGGGISGLSAAFFFQQLHGRDQKILILDSHADFGGQCARNEHTIGDDTRLIYGGSQTIVSPHARSKVFLKLLEDLDVDLDRFKAAFDVDFFKRHNLGAVTYFNKRTFGADRVVRHPFGYYYKYVEGLPGAKLSDEEAVAQTPLSENGKKQLLRVLKGDVHVLKMPRAELQEYIASHSYWEYLKTTLGVDDPAVLEMARGSCVDNAGPGTDVLTIREVLGTGGMGFDPATLKDVLGKRAYKKYVTDYGNIMLEEDPYIHHFPDGNATLTRSLVKKMIPRVGEGNSAEEIVLSRFDYSELDKARNSVRIRLNSTAVNVRHVGDPASSSEVLVDYVHDNRSFRIRGKNVVMACFNGMIPYIVPDLPEKQAKALKRIVRMPLQYTSVGLKNWRALKEMGIGLAMSPGNMHQAVLMDFPVSMGGYRFTKTPDDPCVINMIGCPFGETVGAPPMEQFSEARFTMLGLQFKDYEEEIREHLSGMLPKRSFEFDRDVESITVNRWSHGYAYAGSDIFDPDIYQLPRTGRRPFGRITIANADSAPNAYIHAAVDQAWRAVTEFG